MICNVYLPFLFFVLAAVFQNGLAVYKCKCTANFMITCQSNATADDLCHECKLTPCGKDVRAVYFHYYPDAPCLATNVTSCCPHVQSVIVDDKASCDCYCNMTGVEVIVSPQTKPFECSCSGRTTPTTTKPSDPAKGIDTRSALIGFGGTVGVAFGIAVLVIAVVFFRKYKDGNFSFRRMSEDNSAPIMN